LQRLPEKIDYFACFGLAPRLQIDLPSLQAKFHELSRKFHPDFYQKRSEEERAISLENAALLNKAYRVLKDPLRRVEYLIGWIEGEKALPADAPSDLFDEIFELQETLEEIKNCDHAEQRASLQNALEATREKFQKRQEEELRRLEAHFGAWDRLMERSGNGEWTDEQKKSLGEMKKILSHRAYFERALNDIRSALGEEGKG
jgi:molecular chaperone HscB